MTFGNAAVRAVQYYPEIRAWYLQKKRRKGERIAKALVAKEIPRIVFHVWKKDEGFSGRFKGAALDRVKQEQWPFCSEARTVYLTEDDQLLQDSSRRHGSLKRSCLGMGTEQARRRIRSGTEHMLGGCISR